MSTTPDPPITRADLDALRAAIRADMQATIAQAIQDAADFAAVEASMDEPGEDLTMDEIKRRFGLE